jgi:4-hydroxyphenylacetate 3-monooxygenase
MRTGAEYREVLRDGRRVWVMGEGWAADVTAHPATRPMVEEYAAWYDRHLDPAWEELLLAPADADGKRVPWAYVVPKGVTDLIGMGRSFAKTIFLSAGNITHTPAYGNLIALGVLTAVQSRNASRQQVAEAVAYREMIARTGRFLTYCGGAPIIGQRMRPDPRDRVALMPAGLGSYACLNDDARRRTRGRLLRPWPCSRHDWGGDNPRAAR